MICQYLSDASVRDQDHGFIKFFICSQANHTLRS